MTLDEIVRWLAEPRTERLATLHAGAIEDIADLVVHLRRSTLAVIGKRQLCDAVAMRLILEGGSKPRIEISRGLAKDSAIITELPRDTVIVLQTRVVFDTLCDESRQLAQTLRMLGGYDIDRSVWRPVLKDRLRDRLKRLVQDRTAALILADDVTADVAVQIWPAARLFELPTKDSGDRRTRDAYPTEVIEPQTPPTQESVVAHAHFLSGTDMAALTAMHRPIAGPEFADVFAIWRSNLSIVANQSGGDGAAATGLQILTLIEAALNRATAT
jgi:hypothetical protein